MVNHFWQSVDAGILEDVSLTETIVWGKPLKAIIFQFSKNYCSPTCATSHGRPNQFQRKETVALKTKTKQARTEKRNKNNLKTNETSLAASW